MPYTWRVWGGSVSGEAAYWKPEFQPVRTGFHTPRSVNPDTRNSLRKSSRLMDFCLGTLDNTDPDYLNEITPAEFAVVDMLTGEKGWFSWRQDITPEQVTGMVDSWFNSASRRVAFRLWVV